MSRGPKKSGFNPVKEYYRCLVKNCNSEFKGDEISKHFTKNAIILFSKIKLRGDL